MPRRTSSMICVFPSLEHSTGGVRNPQTILGLLCVPPCWHQKVRSLSAVCRTLPVNCPNVERHRIRCPTRHGRNIRIFLQKLAAPVAFWNYIFSSILIAKRIPFKIQYRVAAPSAASHLNLHIRSDCSSAISRNPHTSHGYHTVPPSQARSLPWTDHSSRLQYRPVFSP